MKIPGKLEGREEGEIIYKNFWSWHMFFLHFAYQKWFFMAHSSNSHCLSQFVTSAIVQIANVYKCCCFVARTPDRYAVRFIPRENGVHYIHGRLNGNHIPVSPFRVLVGKQDADAGKVRAYGDGLSRWVSFFLFLSAPWWNTCNIFRTCLQICSFWWWLFRQKKKRVGFCFVLEMGKNPALIKMISSSCHAVSRSKSQP